MSDGGVRILTYTHPDSSAQEKARRKKFRRTTKTVETKWLSIAHGSLTAGYVFRSHVKSEHESICALELVSLRTFLVSLDLIGHHYEPIISRRSPVLNVLEHSRFVRHTLKALQLDLGSFAAIERCMRLVFVEGPGINVTLGGLERFPLDRKNVPDDLAQGLPLRRCRGLIKRDEGPVHLPLGEIAAQIAVNPELGAGEISGPEMPFVDFIGIVELAVVVSLAVVVMRGRMGVEIAHAEVWTTAGFNRGGVDCPV